VKPQSRAAPSTSTACGTRNCSTRHQLLSQTNVPTRPHKVTSRLKSISASKSKSNNPANNQDAFGTYQLQLIQVKLQLPALTPPLISRTLPRLLSAETQLLSKPASKTVACGLSQLPLPQLLPSMSAPTPPLMSRTPTRFLFARTQLPRQPANKMDAFGTRNLSVRHQLPLHSPVPTKLPKATKSPSLTCARTFRKIPLALKTVANGIHAEAQAPLITHSPPCNARSDSQSSVISPVDTLAHQAECAE